MDSQLQTMIANMPEKTGKSLDEWFAILAPQGFEKHGQALKFLKSEHGVSHGFANTIVSLFRQQGEDSEPDLVDSQYTGKEALRPIHDAIIQLVSTFGTDVEIAPKKSSVSLRRKKQFALIKPATKTRIDLGLKFKDKETGERLGNSGPFGTMCTHRVQITEVSQVDGELTSWLKEAYEEAG